MRRAPKAIIAAHRILPARRELYVEGRNDRLFVDWLVGGDKDPNARIIEIGLVDIPGEGSGGEKGRLLAFAQQVEDAGAQIMILADADTDRIFGRPVPSNVLLTDKRDLEAYVLREECIEKILRLGLLNERLDASDVLRQVTLLGRKLGLLRLMSEIDELDFPFQRTQVSNHITTNGEVINLKLEGYVTALIQNANMSLRHLRHTLERHQQVEEEYSHLDDAEIVHGKDAVVALERLLRTHGVGPNETSRLLRCSYERRWMEDYSSLKQAYDFLTG